MDHGWHCAHKRHKSLVWFVGLRGHPGLIAPRLLLCTTSLLSCLQNPLCQQLAQLRPSDAPRMQPAASLVAPAMALVPARAAPAVDATRPVPRPALAARKAAPARRQADPGLQRLNRLLRPAGIRLIIRRR